MPCIGSLQSLCLFGFTALLFIAPALFGTPGQRIHLVPDFKAGDVLRYQIETRMSTSGNSTTPIANPEGATQLKQSVNIVLRLEILDAPSAASPTPAPMRVRATYEKSAASFETDAFDLNSSALENQYNRLEGRSMEFTVAPDGKLTGFKGLEDLLSNPASAQTVRSWMASLSSSEGFPPEGIAIGQKWSREQPLTGIPLANLFSHTEATYLRNEPCPAANSEPSVTHAAKPPVPNSSSETCAIILTRFEIVRRRGHGSQADETPDDYRRSGLRTSGTWTGSGESLDSISLATSRVVTSTQSSSQDMDYTITSASTGSQVKYKGRTQSQSQINVLPPAPPQPAP